MVADAVIYHPTVAHFLKYVATTGTPLSPPPHAVLAASKTQSHLRASDTLD